MSTKINSAYQAALRLLGRRDYSRKDLTGRLQRKGFDRNDVEQALQRCIDLNYIDDRRLAERLAAELQSSGRAVGRRLQLELQKRGIDPALAEAVAAEQETDPAPVIRRVLEQKFFDYDDRRAEQRERRRVVSYFLRRGFRLGTILDALRESTDE